MAEIVRDRDEWGERLVWWVEWQGNDGSPEERYFRTRREAEKFAVDIESGLLLQAVADFKKTWAEMSDEERSAFNEMLEKRAPRSSSRGAKKLVRANQKEDNLNESV
jgi:hypothetical protein